MHVHGLDPNATNLYSAVAAEKSAATKQAAEVRKKLLSSGSNIEGEAGAESDGEIEAISVIDGGNKEDSPPGEPKDLPASDEHASNKKSATEEDDSGDPISLWG